MEYLDTDGLRKALLGAYESLEANKETVNALNVFPVPDGDTGTNMALTMSSSVKDIRSSQELSLEEVLNRVAKGSLMGARGNSGVILSQLFRGFTKSLAKSSKIDVKALAVSFKEGSDMAYKAVMKPTEGTILTVSRACAEKAMEISKKETDIVEFLKKTISYGNYVLDKTPDMLPVLKEAGVVDAGGKGLMIILEGALDAITDSNVSVYKETEESVDSSVPNYTREDIKYAYCTEFIINNTKTDPESFKEQVADYGDSILVVGSDDMIKVHLHTNNPGKVLEKALLLGELIDIKIDNMKYQHRELYIENDHSLDKKAISKYGIVAVSAGDGINEVFKDLGVEKIISGGQTMNPSTEDILKAVESIEAENVLILPNNKNIILAASQAKELSQKNVEVLMTKSIQQGIASLLAFGSDLEIEENVKSMTEAFKDIKTAEVTFSVKETYIEGVHINEGDIIGISSKRIESVGSDINEVAASTIEKIMEEDTEILTLFYGQDIEEEAAENLKKSLESLYPDTEIELLYGGQPLYYYLISLE